MRKTTQVARSLARQLGEPLSDSEGHGVPLPHIRPITQKKLYHARASPPDGKIERCRTEWNTLGSDVIQSAAHTPLPKVLQNLADSCNVVIVHG